MTASTGEQRWQQALLALAVYATAPHAVGGLVIRSAPGPVRECLLEELREALRDHPIKRVPCTVSESRLIGGIDLTATLASNTLHWEQGLVAQANGGTLILNMAERTERRTVAHLASCLDGSSACMVTPCAVLCHCAHTGGHTYRYRPASLACHMLSSATCPLAPKRARGHQ